jgi:pyruvate dehydrogenase E1 component beta subunit
VAESGIIGVSLGMAMNGLRPIAEMQFSGFSYMGLAQVENHVSRIRWRTRGRFSAPMVIRMPYGAGVHALEHHSESREVFYAHMPGLKTVIPATPARARALLHAAVQDPDPVVFMEPKAVYRAGREEVPETAEPAELGRARTAREGDAATIVSWGAMLSRALEAAETAAEEDGVEAEVLDLETIAPIDAEAIAASVSRTGRLLVVDEAPRSYGPAGEIVMRAAEGDFYALRAAPRRVTGWDVHVPYFAREQAYLPDAGRITRALRAVVSEG